MIGCTVSTIGGLSAGIQRAKEQNLDCIQVYTANSRRWNNELLNKFEAESIKKCKMENSIDLISHVPFLVNLASPDHEIKKKSIARLKIEVINASLLGIRSIILHPGSYIEGSIEAGIDRIADGLNQVEALCLENNVDILLETMSGQGTQLGSSFEQLASILNRTINNKFISCCFDTAHVYAAGYDISSLDSYEKTIMHFSSIVGKNKIKAFHINNTKIKIGKKVDRHSSIFDGEIMLDVFKKIAVDDYFFNVPKILEPSATDITGFEQVKYLMEVRGEVNEF
jgi:deoxyribonuclease-4